MRAPWGAAVLSVVAFCLAAAAGEVRAAGPGAAYVVVDAGSGAVLAAENATHPWYPASVTKAMTAYMVFEALAEGRLALDRRVPISARAAAQPPTKLGLGAGTSVPVKLLLEALIVRSANDAAVALAEAVSGSEAAFAAAMTRRAQALGMTQTVFANASGLPDPAQVTTARDLAVLGRALMTDHPGRFDLFSKRHVAFGQGSQPTLNGWLSAYKGAEGIKTGFTCGSGYNILAAASRDGRRLVAVVLGAMTGGERSVRLRKLMDAAFRADAATVAAAPRLEALPRRAGGLAPYVLADGVCAVAPSPGTDLMAAEALPGWGLVFGSFVSKDEASARIEGNQAALKDVVGKGRPAIVARTSIATHRYSALLVDLSQDDAGAACRHLQALGVYCLAVPPKLLNNPQALWR
ncbi:MAG: D-alanyl-D-alanine carboxypeptidase family protein [Kiloniellaceae bacterium]